jgi:hypothetical protein
MEESAAMADDRLARRVRSDFPTGSAEDVLRRLTELAISSSDTAHWSERVQAAVVLCAGGDFTRFTWAYELALTDWRDVLVAAGLADEDWPDKLDRELGSP